MILKSQLGLQYFAQSKSGQIADIQKSGALEVRESHKDTVIGGQAQKESIDGGIIMTPAPIIDPFSAWKPPFLIPDAIKNQRKARNAPIRGLWVT